MHKRHFHTTWLVILLSAVAQVEAGRAQTESVGPSVKVSIDGKGLEVRAGRPLFKLNVDGTSMEQLTHAPGRVFGSPDWSADGKWIACDTWKLGTGFAAAELAVMRADGTNMRLLGPGAMPSWSPDGKLLVCHTYESPQTIVTMNADGSGRETILNHWGSPRWSPKGNRIASVGEGRASIALFDLATGKERAIFRGPYSLNQGFSISPDGRRFCFGDSNGGSALATLDERTMQATVRWLVRSGECYHSTWSPDGRRIAFAWKRPNRDFYQVHLIDVDANEKPVPLEGQDPSRHNSDPDWSPDGKSIVFSSQGP
ncbi:MAG: hypothetical protein L0228_21220 [Planctomycetes bacterium]|nr:hypothetical protein [Planctomycetota bacterium]